MPLVNANVGSADANSYVTLAEADAYFTDTFGRPLWADRPESDREALIITASRTLDQYMAWSGLPATDTQSMGWPRRQTYDQFGVLYPDNLVPRTLKYAVYEVAYLLLESGPISFGEQTLDRIKVASIELEFSKDSVDSGLPKFIETLLGNLGTPVLVGGNNAITIARLIRT